MILESFFMIFVQNLAFSVYSVSLWNRHTVSVWKPHKGVCGCHTRACCCCTTAQWCLSTGEYAGRKHPKNTISATNGVATPPFGPIPWEMEATPLRMPGDPKTPQKDQKSAGKRAKRAFWARAPRRAPLRRCGLPGRPGPGSVANHQQHPMPTTRIKITPG